MEKREFGDRRRRIDDLLSVHTVDKAAVLANVLLAEILNECLLTGIEALAEVDVEALVRPRKRDDEDQLQSEVVGAGTFDPAAPLEDPEETLSEFSPINQKRNPNPHGQP